VFTLNGIVGYPVRLLQFLEELCEWQAQSVREDRILADKNYGTCGGDVVGFLWLLVGLRGLERVVVEWDRDLSNSGDATPAEEFFWEVDMVWREMTYREDVKFELTWGSYQGSEAGSGKVTFSC
jgi:hypothetical protein